MPKPDRRPRPRRAIAADEAHSWARNLKLGNIHAKLILSMVTLYVDVEGVCFVSIPSLAEDCRDVAGHGPQASGVARTDRR